MRATIDFGSLTVRDLLEAREAYHVHLANLDNVVATAIGRYRTRSRKVTRKAWSTQPDPGSTPKSFGNTYVHEWSWPAVLVFVDSWLPPDQLPHEEMVPSRLYLPDGRVVPTCVLLAEPGAAGTAVNRVDFPDGLTGGGFPVLTNVQGQQRISSVGCLVTDGDKVFALTNRHVTGRAGREVCVSVGGKERVIGHSSGREAAKLALPALYDGWPCPHTFVNVDAGLVEVLDIADWTAQVYGVGEIGPLYDISADTLRLGILGTPVRAYGAASGLMRGEIVGLFFRYASVGGADYVAEFLIGPRQGEARTLPTHHGDSGTIWFEDIPEPGGGLHRGRRLRPLALQWGGSELTDPGQVAPSTFALASALSTICKSLDVQVIRDWRTGLSEYWGKLGHYKIGALACELVTDAKLRALMMANRDRVGFDDAALIAGNLPKNKQSSFVALADVPDLVWRSRRKKDQANHFADMDQPGKGDFEGKTLADLWATPARRTPETWTAFYESLGITADKHRGALPFRVWQIYQALVEFAAKQDIAHFVAAAGILAHYVGDASQPLHVSYLHHGHPGEGEEKVHAAYETTMLDRNAAQLVQLVAAARKKGGTALVKFTGGGGAANATVDLMRRTVATLPPADVIDAFDKGAGRNQVAYMWNALGERTATVMVDGARTLAATWQSAWAEGHGAKIATTRLVAVDTAALSAIYGDRGFIPSAWLSEMKVDGGRIVVPATP